MYVFTYFLYTIYVRYYRDAFTGVMTLEKLRKEYKRIGPAGVVQLWEMLTAHLQRLVAHKSNSLDFLST